MKGGEIAREVVRAARRRDINVLVDRYLAWLYEMRRLKMFLADINEREFDPTNIDKYSDFFNIPLSLGKKDSYICST